jgi:ribosomal protein L40E
MYCTQCGSPNDEQATTCVRCQASLFRPGTPLPPRAQTIPNYLAQSILVTLCCCQVPGIVAIVYAAQVNGLLAAQDFERASRCSRLAYIWSWVGFGLGLLIVLAYGGLVLIGGLASR